MLVTEFTGVIRCFDREGHRLVMHGRRSSAVIITLRGRIRFTFADQTLYCDREHPIFIPRGADYRNDCLADAESLIFGFQTDTDAPRAETLPRADLASASARFAAVERTSGGEYSAYAIMSELYGLLSELYVAREPQSRADELVKSARELMSVRLTDPGFTCASAASELHISEIYLRKLFAEKLGKPPSEYLFSLRMERAKGLLYENHSVTEAAEQSGFGSIYRFSRAFKKRFGFPPSRLRLI